MHAFCCCRRQLFLSVFCWTHSVRCCTLPLWQCMLSVVCCVACQGWRGLAALEGCMLSVAIACTHSDGTRSAAHVACCMPNFARCTLAGCALQRRDVCAVALFVASQPACLLRRCLIFGEDAQHAEHHGTARVKLNPESNRLGHNCPELSHIGPRRPHHTQRANTLARAAHKCARTHIDACVSRTS